MLGLTLLLVAAFTAGGVLSYLIARRGRWQSEKRLRQLASIVEASDDAMELCTMDGVVLSWNAAGERLFGFTAGEIVGHSVSLIADDAGRAEQRELLEKLGRGERLTGYETIRYHKDGRAINVALTISPITGASGRPEGIAVIYRDITVQKRAAQALRESEQALRAARDAAEAANRAKSEFLANMSHEIRTPMNGIIGMTELALDTDLEPEQREYLDMVRSSADSLLTIINDILDFSKIEARKLEVDEVDFELNVMLDEASSVQALRAHQKGLELVFFVDARVPTALRGDPTRIRQVLLNLVSNAVKFTERGDVVVQVKQVGTTSGASECELQFSVADTGMGIAPEKQAAVFEAFTQADNSMTRRFGGTGLGLTIARQLVGLMGGRMWLESEPGKGSTFHFTVRCRTRPSAIPDGRDRGFVDLRGIRALVVDDNAMNRRLLQETLSNWGMKPTLVEGGQAALDALEAAQRTDAPFALVLLDFQMPEMDGFEVAARIQQNAGLRDGGPTVMMLSSVGQRGDGQRCKELGIAAYLSKPVRQAVLLDAIRAAIGSAPRQSARERPLVTRHSLREERRTFKVLLAEDNPVNRALIVNLLGKQHHQVVVAENGREAVAAQAEHRCDVVLMDVQMPEMDGFEATAAIRQAEAATGEHVHIIALTAHAMRGDRERCLAAGMDAYLTKPLRPQELYDAIAGVATTARAGS